MELRHIRASRKRFAAAFAAASLCCLLFLGAAGAGTETKEEESDPCLTPITHPPNDDFELVPQQFSAAAPQFDLNNLMLNPQWGYQVKHRPEPGATPMGINFPESISADVCGNPCFRGCAGKQQPTMDRPNGCFMCNLAQHREKREVGHVNWFAATYTGTVCFHNCSYPDMDFTFSLVTKNSAGLTRWNHPNKPPDDMRKPNPNPTPVPAPLAMHIELDSRESVNRFKSPIWSKFDSMAAPWEAKDVGKPGKNSRDLEGAKKMIEKRRAVVIGLVGLDSAHTVYSELHPVYAMAIEMNPDPDDNTWIVFARNTGNEGACAVEDHPLTCPQGGGDALRRLTLLIPPPPGTTGVPPVMSTAQTLFYSNTPGCAQLSYFVNPDARYTEDNQGVLVSFDLGDCKDAGCVPLVEGEIHLKWTGKFPPQERPKGCSTVKDSHLDACIIREEDKNAKDMRGEDDEEHKLGVPNSQQAARLISLLGQERGQYVSQMKLCPPVGEAAIVQGPPPAAAVCQPFDPLAAIGGPRSTSANRVKDLRRKIEEILGKKPGDK